MKKKFIAIWSTNYGMQAALIYADDIERATLLAKSNPAVWADVELQEIEDKIEETIILL